MKALGVILCSILTLRSLTCHHIPDPEPGLCERMRLQCNATLIGSYCPECDADGNFLPQQCWASTGYCWCVDVASGEEIPHTSTPPGTPRVNCAQLEHWDCADGWSGFGDTCFTFINTPKKWIEAEVYCQFDGGNLASIHSEEENHFIMSLTRGYSQDFPQTWLGGFDAVHPGYWMWSDGSDFNYENWYDIRYGDKGSDHHDNDDHHDDDHDDHDDDSDGENDDDHHDEPHEEDEEEKSCLRINYEYDLKWFHGSCTKYLPFVCAKKAHRVH